MMTTDVVTSLGNSEILLNEESKLLIHRPLILSHLRSSSEVKFVQLVLEPVIPPSQENRCTICGNVYIDKTAFNFHIKQHLKDKLTVKRKIKEREEEAAKKPITPKKRPLIESELMAELAACKPVPPESVADLSPGLPPLIFPPTPANSVCSAQSPKSATGPHLTEAESDLSCILDMIEQDYNKKDSSLATPPDSDVDESSMSGILNTETLPKLEDELDLDVLINEAIGPSPSPSVAKVQSPSSVAKVGPLPPKALEVLNQLPPQLFSPSGTINVVKVERSGPDLGPAATVINVESSKGIVESYRAVQSQTGVRLVPFVKSADNTPKSPSKNLAECEICGKSITTKNMARHMEKHKGKKKFKCVFCSEEFIQKFQLKNHNNLFHRQEQQGEEENSDKLCFSCSICGDDFESLDYHKSLHCSICSELFEDQETLIRHLSKFHPDTALLNSNEREKNPLLLENENILSSERGFLDEISDSNYFDVSEDFLDDEFCKASLF